MKKRMFLYFFVFLLCLFHFSIPSIVFGSAQQVFNTHKDLLLRNDVRELLPKVLLSLKNPQYPLSYTKIGFIAKTPNLLRSYIPDVDSRFVDLLKVDDDLKLFLVDDLVRNLILYPDKIDNLVSIINKEPKNAASLEKVPGTDNQHNKSNTALDPFEVIVKDVNESPLEGIDVTFKVTLGSGELSHSSGTTNKDGRAKTTLTLGSNLGIYQVKANVADYPSLMQTFTAAATRDRPGGEKPTKLNIVSGNNQSGEVNKPLAEPFVVGVLDQEGKPFKGAVVTFVVTAGNGRLLTTRQNTNIYGQARTTLTLGSKGNNSVRASVSGLTPQTFTATADDDRGSSTSETPPMYWIEGNRIYYRPTGGEKEIFLKPRGGTLTGGLAVDTVGGKVYWTEQTHNETGRIQSANLDGTTVQMVREILAVPYNIAFDAVNMNLYWTNSKHKIQRINVNNYRDFDGNFIKGLKDPKHIAFDVKAHASDSATRRLYWADANGIWSTYPEGVKRKSIPLDNEDLGKVGGITVANGVVYWTEQTDDNFGRVKSMNRSGNDAKLLAVTESIPKGIAVDPESGKVYWTTSGGKIQSAPLAGAIQTVVTGVDEPTGIALGRVSVESVRAAPSVTVPLISPAVSVENTLLANYPNPFNPETWIPYQLSASAYVSVSIYSVNGHLVRRLDLGHQSAGVYQNRSRAAYWDGRNEFGERVASGLYFYTLTAGDFTATRKMLIRK